MVSFYNTFGKISMTSNYFSELVSTVAQSGYGVASMSTGSTSDSLKSIVIPDFPEKGVRVVEEEGKLLINLHINVVYGLNIAAAAKSISHKVRYLVEEATGLKVKQVNVSVDDVIG